MDGRRRGRIRGPDGWVASPTQWTWTRANLRRRWRSGTSGVHEVTKSQTRLGDWTTKRAKKKKGGKIHSHLVAWSKQKFCKNMADLWYMINKAFLTDTFVTGPQRSLHCITVFKHIWIFSKIQCYALKETSKIINGLQLYDIYSETKRIWNKMSLAIEWTSPVAQRVKESASTMPGAYRHRSYGLDPRVRKIPWRRKWQLKRKNISNTITKQKVCIHVLCTCVRRRKFMYLETKKIFFFKSREWTRY